MPYCPYYACVGINRALKKKKKTRQGDILCTDTKETWLKEKAKEVKPE